MQILNMNSFAIPAIQELLQKKKHFPFFDWYLFEKNFIKL